MRGVSESFRVLINYLSHAKFFIKISERPLAYISAIIGLPPSLYGIYQMAFPEIVQNSTNEIAKKQPDIIINDRLLKNSVPYNKSDELTASGLNTICQNIDARIMNSSSYDLEIGVALYGSDGEYPTQYIKKGAFLDFRTGDDTNDYVIFDNGSDRSLYYFRLLPCTKKKSKEL